MPEATYIESAERLLPHAARDLALSDSQAGILVSTDPDCVADPDWLRLLTAAVRDGADLAVGGMGVMPSGRRAMGIHLCKFADYLPGLDPGRRAIAPSANLAVSRRAWEAVGPFPAEQFVGDAVLSWRVAQRFGPARFVPEAIVRHHHEDQPGTFLRSRRSRGREFATARARHFRWSRSRAAAHAAAFPLLAVPPVVAGIGAAVQVGLRRQALSSLPLHLAGPRAWTLGEAGAYGRIARAGGGGR
jgi:GT2 family glycosyltransferase